MGDDETFKKEGDDVKEEVATSEGDILRAMEGEVVSEAVGGVAGTEVEAGERARVFLETGGGGGGGGAFLEIGGGGGGGGGGFSCNLWPSFDVKTLLINRDEGQRSVSDQRI